MEHSSDKKERQMKKSNILKSLLIMKQTEMDLFYSEALYISECIKEEKDYYGINPNDLILILEDICGLHPSRVEREDLQQHRSVRKIIREILRNN